MSERSAILADLCQHYEAVSLYVFGSRAEEVRDGMHKKLSPSSPSPSDVDLGIKVLQLEDWPVTKKVSFSPALEEFFNCRRADLVILDEADPFLAAEIVRGERLYARDEVAADEYDLFVLRRAGDLAPLERERIALVFGEQT